MIIERRDNDDICQIVLVHVIIRTPRPSLIFFCFLAIKRFLPLLDSTLACRPPLSCYEVEPVSDQGQDQHHLGALIPLLSLPTLLC